MECCAWLATRHPLCTCGVAHQRHSPVFTAQVQNCLYFLIHLRILHEGLVCPILPCICLETPKMIIKILCKDGGFLTRDQTEYHTNEIDCFTKFRHSLVLWRRSRPVLNMRQKTTWLYRLWTGESLFRKTHERWVAKRRGESHGVTKPTADCSQDWSLLWFAFFVGDLYICSHETLRMLTLEITRVLSCLYNYFIFSF
jgi:hypothetical protein